MPLVYRAALALASAMLAGGCSPDRGSASVLSAARRPERVRLERSAHPLARSELDVGALPHETRLSNLSLVFKLTPEQTRDRDALLAAQVDPTSPSFHRWLTPGEYAARFGARPADVDLARAWLASQGLEVHEPSPLGARASFSGTVGAVEAAFHSQMRRYSIGGETHYAMATAPAVPSALADVVLGLHNAHSFVARPASRRAAPVPAYVNGNDRGLGPPDWANIYGVAPLYSPGAGKTPLDGTGVTIAIVGTAKLAQADIDAFRAAFKLPASTVAMTLVPNTGPAVAGTVGEGLEGYLDVEWAGGIAPKAAINFVFVGSQDPNVESATYYAIEQNLAPVLSESWGGCEYQMTPADADIFAVYGSAASLLGISYLAASGDAGAADCAPNGVAGLYVDMPASYPSVTAVGGTQFPAGSISWGADGYATGYPSGESAWKESDRASSPAAGGGGVSAVFARPEYQSQLPTCSMTGSLPTGVTPSAMRQVPDVAVAASSSAPGYFVACTLSGQDCSASGKSPAFYLIGGTSAGTPSMAGVVALANQATKGRLGNINPMLYALQRSVPSAFHDITSGDNKIQCKAGADPGCPAGGQYGFAAATGYDCATGLGAPNAAVLINAWAALAPTATVLTALPASTSEGAAVALNAKVTVPAPTSDEVGGTVTYAFQSYNPDGTSDLNLGSWTLGAQAVASGTTSGGTATLSAAIPPGAINPGAQYVDVVAMYGGDAHHLASTSPKVRVSFAPIDFCLSPSTASLAPRASVQFSPTGGAPPLRWFVGEDSLCDSTSPATCANIDESTGAFIAGNGSATVLVLGIDKDGAQAYAHVTVGSPTGTPAWGDVGATVCPEPADGGATDAPAQDGGAQDGAMPADGGSSQPGLSDGGAQDALNGNSGEEIDPFALGIGSGCGCRAEGTGSSGGGAMAGILMGLALVARRRRAEYLPEQDCLDRYRRRSPAISGEDRPRRVPGVAGAAGDRAHLLASPVEPQAAPGGAALAPRAAYEMLDAPLPESGPSSSGPCGASPKRVRRIARPARRAVRTTSRS